MRIAVIGSGVSGLAAAHTLMRFGHEVVVYEKSASIGGVWAIAYPEVRLQNIAEHYRLSDFPWPFPPDLHPTAAQVMAYLEAAVAHFGIDVRLRNEVLNLTEKPNGWRAEIDTDVGTLVETFDYVVVATGHYTEPKAPVALPGQERFKGAVLSEREVRDLEVFRDKRVAVVGFGKTAVDMAIFAADRGARVSHVFRAPRWLLPRKIFGMHMSHFVPARMTTRMVPSWVHTDRSATIMHRRMGFFVAYYWWITELIFRASMGMHRLRFNAGARRRIGVLNPGQPLTYQMRAAVALAPDSYFPLVIGGSIEPVRGELDGFDEGALLLKDGTRVESDVVVLAIGNLAPQFGYLPERYRAMMTEGRGGTQLYRHVVHPRIPRLAFAGFNHGFLHIPAVEVAMVWVAAVLGGDLVLPAAAEMEASTARVAAWKEAHTLYEPTRAHGIGNRFHHYLDVLLQDLGLRYKRKTGAARDMVEPYTAADYAGVFDEYVAARAGRREPRFPVALDT